MAINTKEKRASIVGIPTPNSSKDAEWRREIIGMLFTNVNLYPFALSGGEGSGDSDVTKTTHKMSMRMGMGM